jgi:hypothetical protein
MHRANGHNEILLPERNHNASSSPNLIAQNRALRARNPTSSTIAFPSLPLRKKRLLFALALPPLQTDRQKSFFPPPKISNISRFPLPLLIDGKYSPFPVLSATGKKPLPNTEASRLLRRSRPPHRAQFPRSYPKLQNNCCNWPFVCYPTKSV